MSQLVRNFTIGCMGDSMVEEAWWGGEPGLTLNNSWVKILAELNHDDVYINAGRSGQTTKQQLMRFETDIIAHHPDICVLMGCVNDIFNKSEGITTSIENTITMITLCRANNITPCIVVPVPQWSFSWKYFDGPEADTIVIDETLYDYDPEGDGQLQQLRFKLEQLAAENGLVCVDLYNTLFLKSLRENDLSYYKSDRIHPNDAGYQVMADVIGDALTGLKQRMLVASTSPGEEVNPSVHLFPHWESMQNHLIMQFKEAPNIGALLGAIGAEMDELTRSFYDLRDKRWIDTGEGVQLDGIGRIVGRSRTIDAAIPIPFFGFHGQPAATGFEQARFRDNTEAWLASCKLNDPEYRMVLWNKVAKNISQGRTEDTVNSVKFVFGLTSKRKAPMVSIQDIGNAKFILGIARKLTYNEIIMANALDLVVRAGGVGIWYTVHYEYDNYFGFQGQPSAKTFDIGSFADII